MVSSTKSKKVSYDYIVNFAKKMKSLTLFDNIINFLQVQQDHR